MSNGIYGKMKKFILVLGILLQMNFAFAKNALKGYEFVDRSFEEIFYSLSLYTGIQIYGDETIEGSGTFRCAGDNLESAFEAFLTANRMFLKKLQMGDMKLWYVTKLDFHKDGESLVINALDVYPNILLERMAYAYSVQISYDNFDNIKRSFNLRGKNVEEMLNGFCLNMGSEYKLEKIGGAYHIYNEVERAAKERELNNEMMTAEKPYLYQSEYFNKSDESKISVSYKDGIYNIDAYNASLDELFCEIFEYTNMPYIFQDSEVSTIKRVFIRDKTFPEVMNIICDATGKNWEWVECSFAIYDLTYTKYNNGKYWKEYRFNYITFDDIYNVLKQTYPYVEFYNIHHGESVMIHEHESVHEKVQKIIELSDKPATSFLIPFKYIKANEFLSALPPGFKEENFKRSIHDDEIYFLGSEDKCKELKNKIAEIDLPEKILSYDLLVMQYQYSGEETWECNLGASQIGMGDYSGGNIALGSVLNFNMDIVSTFGYKFAASLQSAINDNKAHIYADTKLYGLNGGKINFQNTNTYRYRDNNVNPETGKPLYTGVTREIVSGLKIDVEGWISGDGMITSAITASVSRQGNDSYSKNGNPPSSSEKIISTRVRGRSGEPIVLSGLLEMDEELGEGGVPGLSKIPILGWFFKSRKKTDVKNELVIYLVPHWINDALKKETSDSEVNSVALSNAANIDNLIMNEDEKYNSFIELDTEALLNEYSGEKLQNIFLEEEFLQLENKELSECCELFNLDSISVISFFENDVGFEKNAICLKDGVNINEL